MVITWLQHTIYGLRRYGNVLPDGTNKILFDTPKIYTVFIKPCHLLSLIYLKILPHIISLCIYNYCDYTVVSINHINTVKKEEKNSSQNGQSCWDWNKSEKH